MSFQSIFGRYPIAFDTMVLSKNDLSGDNGLRIFTNVFDYLVKRERRNFVYFFPSYGLSLSACRLIFHKLTNIPVQGMRHLCRFLCQSWICELNKTRVQKCITSVIILSKKRLNWKGKISSWKTDLAHYNVKVSHGIASKIWNIPTVLISHVKINLIVLRLSVFSIE